MSRARIRLLQITHGMGIGGTERVVVDLWRNLDPEVYDVSVYCTHVLGPLAQELRDIGVPVVHEAARRRSDHWLRPFRIYRFLRENHFDVVHTHMVAFLEAAIPVRLTHVPVLVHTDHSKFYPEPWRYKIAERILSRLTDAFCAVSEHTRRDLATFEGLPESSIEVVYNGVHLDDSHADRDRREIRALLDIDDRAPVIGTVGRCEWEKGHDLLLDAMPSILARVPDARAVIVGGGSKEPELRSKIRDLGLEGKVHMMGSRLDARRFLAAFDLFASTSIAEGLPLALLEAMASSLPVLGTAVGGVSEVVADGHTGILLDGRDPVRFADEAVGLLADRTRLRDYGQAARRLYERRFAVGAMIGAYDGIYRRCLAARTNERGARVRENQRGREAVASTTPPSYI